ncbi:MAG: hexitol phosphatase HxpB [Sphingobacteriales bacterium]|nr:hexitol phosphatase HxpB [Sphingobacteriales bacterium]
MKLTTVIFDMDGLLIDSEPLWNEAADEVFQKYGLRLTPAQHAVTTGLRIKEYVLWWFTIYKLPIELAPVAEKDIRQKVIEKVLQKGRALPGLSHIFNYFIDKKFKIGLATSSGQDLIEVVIKHLGIKDYLHAIASADLLPYGKPHPQVYLDCAAALNVSPVECICFEDSFNGLIAAKAARMKCVVVPAAHQQNETRWHAADLKISSLQNFNDLLMLTIN